MARRFVLGNLAVFAVLAILAGAALYWRVPLVQALLDRGMVAMAVPGTRARVESVSMGEARFGALAAGDNGEITIDEVQVRYGLGGLLRGRFDEVRLEGLTVTLSLLEGSPLLGSLQPLLDEARTPDPDTESPARREPGRGIAAFSDDLPDLSVRRGRVSAETPYGPAQLDFDGSIAADPEVGSRVRFDGALASDAARLSVQLSADGDPQRSADAQITLSEGRVELPDGRLSVDSLTGDLAIAVEAGRPGAGQGRLVADGLTIEGTPFDKARMDFELGPERGTVEAHVASDDGSFDLSLTARVKELDKLPRLTLELSSRIDADAPVWALSRSPFPAGGEGRIELSGGGEFPKLPTLPTDPTSLRDWLAAGGFSGRAAGYAARLALPEVPGALDAQLDLVAVWANHELSLASRKDNRVTLNGLGAEDLETLGLPPTLAQQLIDLTGGAVSLTTPAPEQQPSSLVWRPKAPERGASFQGSLSIAAGPLTVSLNGVAEAATGTATALTRAEVSEFSLSGSEFGLAGASIRDLALTGQFSGNPQEFESSGTLAGQGSLEDLAGLSADQVTLDLPFALSREADAFSLSLAAPGQVAASGLTAADGLQAAGPIEVEIASHEAQVVLGEGNAISSVRHQTRLALGQFVLRLPGEDGSKLPLDVRAPDVTVAGALDEQGRYRGEAKVRDAVIGLPAHALSLDGLSSDLALLDGPETATAEFAIAGIRHTASPGAFAPLPVAGKAEREGEFVDLTATVKRPDRQALVDVTARHSLADGRGRAELDLVPLTFVPDGLQPAALSPLLADLSDVRGTAEGSANLRWTRDGYGGEARVNIAGLTFSGRDLSATGLDLSLELDSLQPLSSPPEQVLRAARIDIGIPIRNFEASFRLPPDAPGQILVQRASFAAVGSRFALRDARIDLARDRLDTLLQVDELDMAVLFDVLAVDGLTGSGRLAGSIPIRRDGSVLVVENARLEAQAPGVLRFRSDAAKQALAGGGEYVDLVVRALEDFRFETLVLTGNLDPEGEAHLRLEILGHNPNVLEGHPFRLNINLTGDSAPILDAMLLSRTLLKNIMERARRLSE